MTAWLLAFSLVGPAPKARTQILLEAAHPSILVGEPLRLRITWHPVQPIAISESAVTVLVDDGHGFKVHEEMTPTNHPDEALTVGTPVYPDQPRGQALTISVAGRISGGQLQCHSPFSSEGTYRVRVQYGRDAQLRSSLTSNVLVVSVRQPEGRDAELYQKYLKARPELATEWGVDDSPELVRTLIREYGGSPYLTRATLLLLEHDVEKAAAAYHLKGGHDSPLSGEAGSLLDALEAWDFGSENSFDDDRMNYVAYKRLMWGDRSGAHRAYNAIAEKYPMSLAADSARAWLAQEAGIPR